MNLGSQELAHPLLHKILSNQRELFGVYLCQFAAEQQTSTLTLPEFFLRLQSEEGVLAVNKSKIIGENTFNGDHFQIEGNHGSSKSEETLLWIFLQICDYCFNHQIAKYVYLRSSSIVWFLQFLSNFRWVSEDRSELILF